MDSHIDNEINQNWPYNGSKLIPKDQLKQYLKRDNISGLKHLFCTYR